MNKLKWLAQSPKFLLNPKQRIKTVYPFRIVKSTAPPLLSWPPGVRLIPPSFCDVNAAHTISSYRYRPTLIYHIKRRIVKGWPKLNKIIGQSIVCLCFLFQISLGFVVWSFDCCLLVMAARFQLQLQLNNVKEWWSNFKITANFQNSL